MYLGIDYGLKNVGIAASDEEKRLAFPLVVLDNDDKLIKNIKKIIEEENIEKIVLGESTNFQGEPNPIMKQIVPFKKRLEDETGLQVIFQKELFTSAEADKIQGQDLRNVRKQNRQKNKVHLDKNDASAAALILRSHLDNLKV